VPILGAHLINKGSFDPAICQQIQRTGILVVGPNTWYGAGVYAYYADRIPATHRGKATVIFQVQHVNQRAEIMDICLPGHHTMADGRFFLLRVPGVTIGTAIAVTVLGFVNCPSLSTFPGRPYYV